MHATGQRVKVILPSYNRREQLKASIDSVLAQTHRDLRLVVVDDASTDGAAELLREYAARDPRVAAIFKPRWRGVADSVDALLAFEPETPFVAFHANDDLWAPDKLEAQLQEFQTSPDLGLVFTEALLIDQDGRPIGEKFSDLFRPPPARDLAREIFLNGNFICAPSVLVKREVLDLFEPPSPYQLLNDLYMWMVIAAHYEIRFIPRPLTKYRRGPDTLSSTRGDELLREAYEIRAEALRRYPRLVEAVGAQTARQWLDGCALDNASANLRNGRYDQFRWWAGRTLRDTRSPSTVGRLAYLSLRNPAARAVERVRTAR
jgi:glycosyltransferase involved in cell wall biosynthesis